MLSVLAFLNKQEGGAEDCNGIRPQSCTFKKKELLLGNPTVMDDFFIY